MKIKSKVHQQFYSLFLIFFIVISLLLLSFYAVLKVKIYQVTESAIQSDLITVLLADEIKILLMKLDITASYSNFYIFSIACISICVLMLVVLLFKLNTGWKRTYLSHIDFMHTCIDHYEHRVDRKPVNNELFEEVKYREQQDIAQFFVKLTLLSQHSDNVSDSTIIGIDNTHISSKRLQASEVDNTSSIKSNKDNSLTDESDNTADNVTQEDELELLYRESSQEAEIASQVGSEKNESSHLELNVNKNVKTDDSVNRSVKLEALDNQFEHFDLHAFAQKQVSPEFSIVLLEEYLNENKQLLEHIKPMVNAKCYLESLGHLQQLLSNVKVLASTSLESTIEALVSAIENTDNQKVHGLLSKLEDQLIAFTQAVKLSTS